MNIKKLFIGLAVVAVALGVVVSANAQTTLTADQIMQALLANPTLLAQLSGLLNNGATTPASTVSSAPVAPLTIGSKGAEVTALQNFLIGQGISIPAGATGYFGTQTQAAVKAFQIANNITPTAGYYGNLTAAAVAQKIGAGGTVGGGGAAGDLCPNGNTLASNCATPPAGTGTGTTCPNGNLLSNNCAPAGSTVGGTEGSIATKLGATPPQTQANIRSTSNVDAYGLSVEAVGSDMTVDRVDLQMAVTPTGSSAQNPGSFVNKVSFYDGSTLLKEWSVGTSDFLKDSSDRYHMIFTGLGFKVPKGTIKILTVKLSVSSINAADANRVVTIQGYAGSSQNIRAVDTAGFQSYADMSGTANTATLTFKAAGTATLTVTLDNSLTPKAANHKVSTTNGVEKLTMMGFSAKAESGDAKLTKLYIASNATATAGLPSTIYLTDEAGAVLGSVAAGVTDGAEKLISGLSIVIPQDTTKRFLIKADFPTTANGQQASSSLMTNSVQWEKPDGSTASTTPSSEIAGTDQYFNSAVPQWTFVSGTIGTPTKPAFAGGASSTVSAFLTFKVKADGGALTKPVIADFGLGFASSSQTTYTDAQLIGVGETGFSGVVDSITPSDASVGDGGEYTVTVKGTLLAGTSAGVSNIALTSANYKLVATSTKAVVGGVTVTQTWNTADWASPSAFLEHTN
jgi:hypothetical protein